MGGTAATNGNGAIRRLLRSDFAPLLLAAVWVASIAPIRPEILSMTNLGYLAVSAAPLLILAVGQLFVLLVGGIDLSLSAVIGLTSVAGAAVLTESESVPGGIAAMLAIGWAFGCLHGVSVAVLRMPAFLVTLATLVAGGGAAVWVTQAKPITDLPEGFLAIAAGTWWGLTPGVLLAVAVIAVTHVFLARTSIGRQLYAVGLNPATARVSGVPVAARITLAFTLCGLCSSLAAILFTARLEVGLAALIPREILLDVLGAAVIGGASLRGGRGTALGVSVGALVMALIGNSLNLLGLDHWHVMMAKGGLIFLAACLDVLRTRRAT